MTNAPGPDIHVLAALEALTAEADPAASPTLAARIARNPHLAGALAAQAITLASDDLAEVASSHASEPRTSGMRRALAIIFAAPSVSPAEMPTNAPTTRVAEAPTAYAASPPGLRALAAARGLTLEAVLAAVPVNDDEIRRLGACGRGDAEADDAARAEDLIEQLAAALGVPRIRVVAALMADVTALMADVTALMADVTAEREA